MGRIKHKIMSAVEAQINKLAKELPVAYKMDGKGNPVYKLGAVDGSMVTVDKSGNKGVPGVLYSANVLQYMNHREELISAFQVDGEVGMKYYEEYIMGNHNIRQKEIANSQPGLLSRIKRFFRK